MRTPDKTTEKPDFHSPSKKHNQDVTNPVLQDAAGIELVQSSQREIPPLRASGFAVGNGSLGRKKARYLPVMKCRVHVKPPTIGSEVASTR
jgi:hypothetical protein